MSCSSTRHAGVKAGMGFRAFVSAGILLTIAAGFIAFPCSGEETVVAKPEGTEASVTAAKTDPETSGPKIDAANPTPTPPNTVNTANPKSDCNVELPPYRFPYKNGLYATIAGFTAIKDVDLRNVRQMRLNVDGFRRPVPVRAIIQNKPAPLVVVLMGIDGKADGKLGKLWPAWLENNGYHVLTFDSTFLPQFVSISGHGVTGNLAVESERVGQIIAAFLKHGDMKSKVTQVGVVGMSYGGLEAMVLGQMSKEGRLPFLIDAIQAYSPPIRLHHTGELIDQWYEEDRWNYTLVDLADKLSGHKPVSPESPVPFSDSLMRAGISAIFHLGLADVVMKNDSEYKLHLLPTGNQFDDQYVKQDYAETWGYGKFMTEMCYPYWQRKQNLNDVKEMSDPIDLCNLVLKQGFNSEVIIAEDDPFNMPDDLTDLRSSSSTARITFLPTGGHLGFVSDPWTKAKLLSLFKCLPTEVAPAPAPMPTPAPDTHR
jgi:predicted alpha/beta-fold hydrolase